MCVYQTVVQQQSIPCYHGNVLSKVLPSIWSYTALRDVTILLIKTIKLSRAITLMLILQEWRQLFPKFKCLHLCLIVSAPPQSNQIVQCYWFCQHYPWGLEIIKIFTNFAWNQIVVSFCVEKSEHSNSISFLRLCATNTKFVMNWGISVQTAVHWYKLCELYAFLSLTFQIMLPTWRVSFAGCNAV
jgi:hypothetical protein